MLTNQKNSFVFQIKGKCLWTLGVDEPLFTNQLTVFFSRNTVQQNHAIQQKSDQRTNVYSTFISLMPLKTYNGSN